MKITYDPEADAAYLSFKEKRGEVTTVHLTADIAIDLGQGEEVVGIEVLDASKHLGISRAHPVVELQNITAT